MFSATSVRNAPTVSVIFTPVLKTEQWRLEQGLESEEPRTQSTRATGALCGGPLVASVSANRELASSLVAAEPHSSLARRGIFRGAAPSGAGVWARGASSVVPARVRARTMSLMATSVRVAASRERVPQQLGTGWPKEGKCFGGGGAGFQRAHARLPAL
ncbi:hypothetical protein MTO96_048821 [Rhipicephalus appendiculatus]